MVCVGESICRLQALNPLLQLVGLYTANPAGEAASCAPSSPPEAVSRQLGEGDAAQAFIILEKTLEILATAVQNNPEAQQAVADLDVCLPLATALAPPVSLAKSGSRAADVSVLSAQGLRVLFSLVRENPKSKALRVRALQTLGCLLRHHRPSELSFLNSRGLSLLVYAMSQDDPKVSAGRLRCGLEGCLSAMQHQQLFASSVCASDQFIFRSVPRKGLLPQPTLSLGVARFF